MAAIQGIGVSRGIAIGRAMVIGRRERDVHRYRLEPEQVRDEMRRFLVARKVARDEIVQLRERAAASVGEKYAGIFDAHRMIIDDRGLGRSTMRLIRDRHMNAEWALSVAIARLLTAFESVEDARMREKGGDIQDVHQRLQRVLEGADNRHDRQLELSEDTVVVAHTLSPSDAIWLHQPHIVAIVTEEGSRTSHTAILANALEIPAVLRARLATETIEDEREIIVDGSRGRVVYRATDAVREAYLEERDTLRRIGRDYAAEGGPVSTPDGVELSVAANIEFPEEIETCRRVKAGGIGLYRSEFLFLATAPHLPSEEDHLEAYLKIAKASAPETVVIRTLDLGGEKYFHEVLEGGEANPVMGLRAVRFCLRRPDIFRTQLRGLLRAAAETGNIFVLVPMISGLDEWREVRRFVGEARDELLEEGVPVPHVPLGPMIETPASAMIAPELARESEFLSIGTNDLIQYTLAADRANGSVAYLYNPYHPAVLQMIERTIEAARQNDRPVSLCGEMASDPLGALTLVGMGLRHFSCNAMLIPEIRSLLRRVEAERAGKIVEEARASSASEREMRGRLERGFGPVIAEVLGTASAEPAEEPEQG